MDRKIRNAINRIAISKNPKDIEYVNIEIGKYRLEALHHRGFVKSFINNQANEIQRELDKALNYKFSILEKI